MPFDSQLWYNLGTGSTPTLNGVYSRTALKSGMGRVNYMFRDRYSLSLTGRYDGSSVLDPLRENAYGIYLIHYVPVLWLQYWMYDMSFGPVPQISAIIKAAIVLVLTLLSSWAATAALRKIPGATHVL